MSFIQVLNEVVLDRGSSSFLTNLDIFINGNFVTSVQGDGKSFVSYQDRFKFGNILLVSLTCLIIVICSKTLV